MKQLTHYRQEGVGVGLELVLKSVLCFEDFRRISPECADSLPAQYVLNPNLGVSFSHSCREQ